MISLPTHYVILTGSLKTLVDRSTLRTRPFERECADFSTLLDAINCAVSDFVRDLEVPHVVVDADGTGASDEVLRTTIDELAELIRG